MRNIKTIRKLTAVYVVSDIVLVIAAVVLGTTIKTGLSIIFNNPIYFAVDTAFVVLLTVVANYLTGSYYVRLRPFKISDIIRVAASVVLVYGILLFTDVVGIFTVFRGYGVITATMAFALIFMLYLRAGHKIFSVIRLKFKLVPKRTGQFTTVIYGAGELASYFLENICVKDDEKYYPVAILDDNAAKVGRKVCGIPILGTSNELEDILEKYAAETLVIAISELPPDKLKDITLRAKKSGVSVEGFGGRVENMDKLGSVPKKIDFEELLRRDSVNLDREKIDAYIKDKTVMVTGGVGSIGSEICRQVLEAGCRKLIIFDINENGLFHFDNEIRAKYEGKYVTYLGSVRDKKRIDEVMDEFHPQIVFHAAAHKHVPMMEISPKEAIKNNVFGTYNVCLSAKEHGVKRFLLISTDKAVNPTNIMGASKRLAEKVVKMLNSSGEFECVAVRFGNVLGSNGSVVPLFEKQILAGGPVTVTDPEIKRFFMTIPEAVSLVLETGTIAKGGEIFVLDMGKPVKIYDLACDLIRYFGKEPEKDIKIKFVGLRPGEKLFEEISLAEEETYKTESDKINVCKEEVQDVDKLMNDLSELKNKVDDCDDAGMFTKVKEMIPTFNHK